MALTLAPDLALVPTTASSRRYVLATITAPTVPQEVERRPVNLALVLDRSGSMQGSKMQNVRQAAASAIDRLAPRDRFSLVVYDHEIDVLVPSTHATPKARQRAHSILGEIHARGNTDLSTGWLRGCEQVAEHLDPDTVGRVLLLTDGLANAGITGVQQLEEHASQLRLRGVTTSTFGVGSDFNEMLLRKMSEAGGGNFYFIETAREIEDFITSETGEALEVVARDAVLVVGLPDGATMRCLGTLPSRNEGRSLLIRLGNLVSGQELQVLLEVEFPAGETPCGFIARLTDADGAMADDAASVSLARASQEACRAETHDSDVVLAVATSVASRARMLAIEVTRHGNPEKGQAILAAAVAELESYAPQVASVQSLVRDLQREMKNLARMDETDRKRMYMASSSSSRGRSEDGYARRGARSDVALLVNNPDLLRAMDPAQELCHLLLHRHLSPDLVRFPVHDVLEHDDELLWIGKYSRKWQHLPLRLLFVDARLHDHWFSHWHEDERTAVISTADLPPALVPAFVAHEVLLHGLRLLSPAYDSTKLMHPEVRGCVFDFCAVRADLEIKLNTADLCPSCSAALERWGLDVARIRRACEVIREASAQAAPPQ